MTPGTLILRRVYPRLVTFADLRKARKLLPNSCKCEQGCRDWWKWSAVLKQVVGGWDEIVLRLETEYFVDEFLLSLCSTSGLDQRNNEKVPVWSGTNVGLLSCIQDLLDEADQRDYFHRPREILIQKEDVEEFLQEGWSRTRHIKHQKERNHV